MKLQGKKMSFKIFPLNDNELTDISIDGLIRKESYKLDKIEDDYHQKASGTISGEKNKYDFNNFFVQTF